MPELTKRCADAYCCLVLHKGKGDKEICKVLTERDYAMGKAEKAIANGWGSTREACAGKSIKEMMEEELDVIFDRLKSEGGEAADGRDPGRAEGIAWCLAILTNPYEPNINAIRAQAVARYNDRQALTELDMS